MKIREHWEFPGSSMVRTLLSQQRVQVQSLVREIRSHKSQFDPKKEKKREHMKVTEINILFFINIPFFTFTMNLCYFSN